MLDIVTMIWHMSGTLKKCDSGGSSCTEGPPDPRWGLIDMTKTELTGGKVPRVTRTRASAFDTGKQARFLGELAATCNVSLAAAAAGVAVKTVYDRKAKDAAFRAGWSEALGEAYRRLELMMLERAMNGTVKTVTKADGSVDRTHEFPNAIALTLLRLHRDSAAAVEALPDEEDAEALRAEIARRIDRIRQAKAR